MERYKKYKRLKNFFLIISLILTYVPIFALAILGFIKGQPGEKFALGACVCTSIVLFIIQALNEKHFRCTLWIILLGIYMCLDNIAPFLLMIAICTILDDILVRPIYGFYKDKFNKIDTAKEVAEWK